MICGNCFSYVGQSSAHGRTHIVIALEVVQSRMVPQDVHDDRVQLDPEALLLAGGDVCQEAEVSNNPRPPRELHLPVG